MICACRCLIHIGSRASSGHEPIPALHRYKCKRMAHTDTPHTRNPQSLGLTAVCDPKTFSPHSGVFSYPEHAAYCRCLNTKLQLRGRGEKNHRDAPSYTQSAYRSVCEWVCECVWGGGHINCNRNIKLAVGGVE